MTYKTKNTTIVFAFALMLMATPLAIGNAYAVGGSGVINPTCGITAPGNINLGTIIAGSTSSETHIAVPTTGTIPGTFELISSDWTGAGAKATGSLLVNGDLQGDTVTINGLVFTGGDGDTGAGEFDTTTATNSALATALATAINADSRSGGTIADNIEVKAFASVNAVLLTAKTPGATANGLTVASSVSGSDVTIVTTALAGGATGATHMTADKVKVTTLTQSETAPGTAYTNAAKIALAAATVNKVLTTATDPDNAEDVDLYFHLDGVSTKATGTVTVGTLVDGDKVTIDGVDFIAETDSADITGNEFLSVGTAATDATALDAKIDSTLNLRFTSGTVAGAVLPITANNAGTTDNALALAETGGNISLSDSSLNGGIDQLINLPYSGALTATFTFGTACGT